MYAASRSSTSSYSNFSRASARSVADNVGFMDGGRVEEMAAPTEFFANPKSERTRKFLSQILAH